MNRINLLLYGDSVRPSDLPEPTSSVEWAERAVYHARRAVRLSKIAMVLYAISLMLFVVSLVIRLMVS